MNKRLFLPHTKKKGSIELTAETSQEPQVALCELATAVNASKQWVQSAESLETTFGKDLNLAKDGINDECLNDKVHCSADDIVHTTSKMSQPHINNDNGKIGEGDVPPELNQPKLQKAESEELQDELKLLEMKASKMESGMEKMLLEMRIDLKRDNVKVLKRLESVTLSTATLSTEIETMKRGNQQLADKVSSISLTQTSETKRVDQIDTKVESLNKQIRVLHGIVRKQGQVPTIYRTINEQNHLRAVRDNLLISGLDGENDEAPSTTAKMVTDFFNQTMKVGKKVEIISATCIGKAEPKTVLVKLANPKDKMEIFKQGKELKEVRNSKDGEIYVNSQLPPNLQEKKKWYRYLMKYNSGLAGTGKRTLTMRKGELYVGDMLYKPAINPPHIGEIMYPLDPSHVERMKICKGEDQFRGNCQFIGYSVEVRNIGDVRAAYTKIARLHPESMSISCGYRLAGKDFLQLRGYADDNEHGAGRTLYFTLEDSNIFNRALFVARYYGNKHLGPVRFQLIKDAVRTAIDRSAFNEVTRDVQVVKEATSTSAKVIDSDSEVVFKKPANKGYAAAASPRPYMNKNWGSTDSMEIEGSQKEDWSDEPVSSNLRPRSQSMDSSASFKSFR